MKKSHSRKLQTMVEYEYEDCVDKQVGAGGVKFKAINGMHKSSRNFKTHSSDREVESSSSSDVHTPSLFSRCGVNSWFRSAQRSHSTDSDFRSTEGSFNGEWTSSLSSSIVSAWKPWFREQCSFLRNLLIGPPSSFEPQQENIILGGILTGRSGYKFAWNYLLGDSPHSKFIIFFTNIIAYCRLLSSFLLAISTLTGILQTKSFSSGYDKTVDVWVDDQCVMDAWYDDVDDENTSSDKLSQTMCFIMATNFQDTSDVLTGLWSATDFVSGSPDRRHMIVSSFDDYGPHIANMLTGISDHKAKVSSHCGHLFDNWRWDGDSFLHFAQCMLPQCYTKLNDFGSSLKGYLPYQVNIECVCSHLDQSRCAQAQFCNYDWSMNMCTFSHFSLSTEYFLQTNSQGYRGSYRGVTECPLILTPHDTKSSISTGDSECDLQDVISHSLLNRTLSSLSATTIAAIAVPLILLVSGLMAVRGQMFAYLPIAVLFATTLILTFSAMNFCGSLSYPNSVAFETDFQHIDSLLTTTYRSNTRFIDYGAQRLIVDVQQASVDETLRSCTPSPFQTPYSSSITRVILTLVDHRFLAGVIGYALLYSNIGCGIKIHHGTLRHTQKRGIISGLLHPVAELPIMQFSAYSLANYAVQQIGINNYLRPFPAMNQDWWLMLEFPFNFNPFVSLFWTAGLWAAEARSKKDLTLCNSTFLTNGTLLWTLLIRELRFFLCLCECWIFTAHLVHGLCETKSSRLSRGAGFIEHRGRPGLSRRAYKATAAVIVSLVFIELSQFFQSNGLLVLYHFITWTLMRFLLPAYVITVVVDVAWLRDRELAKTVLGGRSILIKEFSFWISLSVFSCLPLLISNYKNGKGAFPEDCPIGWYSCQAFLSFPSNLNENPVSDKLHGFMCLSSWWFVWLSYTTFVIFNVIICIILIYPNGLLSEHKHRRDESNIQYDIIAKILNDCAKKQKYNSPSSQNRVSTECFTEDELNQMVRQRSRDHRTKRSNRTGINELSTMQRLWWLVLGQSRIGLIRIGLLNDGSMVRRKVVISKEMCQNMCLVEFYSLDNFFAFFFAYGLPAVMSFVIQQSILDVAYLQVPWTTADIVAFEEFNTFEKLVWVSAIIFVPVCLLGTFLFFYPQIRWWRYGHKAAALVSTDKTRSLSKEDSSDYDANMKFKYT
eukprot:GHVH01011250.1.p1 GENE.GHVH01011250.1~~GHVH01011250.1.p1  ORF type:complete len:1165 (-),score=124.23 GHVH01011250.1:1603-5097(-)